MSTEPITGKAELKFTDLFGDDHEICGAIHPHWGRVVYYDGDPWRPEQARRIAEELLALAEAVKEA